MAFANVAGSQLRVSKHLLLVWKNVKCSHWIKVLLLLVTTLTSDLHNSGVASGLGRSSENEIPGRFASKRTFVPTFTTL